MPIAQPKDVLDFLKRAHDGLQPLSVRLSFDKTKPQHRELVALYGSIIELTGAVMVLVDKRLITGVPVLLRSVLEAYVDLHNLVGTPSYSFVIELAHIDQWLKILREAKTGKNEYLAAIAGAPELDDRIVKWEKRRADLEEKGFRALNIEQKFHQAGMDREYRSQYNQLCCDAHNNLRSLIDRHIQVGEDGLGIVYYKEYAPADSAVHVGTNAELLVRASQEVHDFFKSSEASEIAKYRQELNALRGETEPG